MGSACGIARRISLDEAATVSDKQASDLLALDEALTSLESLDPRKCRIIELRYIGGLTIEVTAAALNVSHATVEREWKSAKAWLYRAL